MIESVVKTETRKKVFAPPHEVTELLTGDAVLRLLDEVEFQDGWDHLYDSCPWATVFQSRAFVAPWYRLYKDQFLPILVKTEYGGKLTGLFTLTIHKNGVITGAGIGVAEYQAWLSADAVDGAFIKKALVEIRKRFPRSNILVKYLPPNISLNWTKTDRVWSRHCFVKPFSDPLMIINDAHLSAELKKKNRREKMNRLKRLGELKFERITSYTAFASIIDELIIQSDFRKGSRYNKVIFRNDPTRKDFLLALFKQNILHVTVLKINNKIIASNVGISGKNHLYLQGINSHAPELGKHSPGIIHFLLLGKLLAEEEIGVFDLTPGEDGYKEILATDHAQVYTLEIGNKFCRLTNQSKSGAAGYMKKTAALVGINTHARKKLQRDITVFKEKIVTIRKQGPASWLTWFLGRFKRRKKTQRYWQIPTTFISSTAGLLPVQKDDLKDLLDFKRLETIYTRQEFLTDAMRRFEEGEHCYSWVENNVLSGCAWLTNPKPVTGKRIISLSGLYCHPAARIKFPDFLRSIVTKETMDGTGEPIYIVTDIDDGVFEKAGFQSIETEKV